MAAGAIVLLSFVAAVSVVLAKGRVTERIGASAPTVKRWEGYVLVMVGLWFVAPGVFADFFARVFPV